MLVRGESIRTAQERQPRRGYAIQAASLFGFREACQSRYPTPVHTAGREIPPHPDRHPSKYTRQRLPERSKLGKGQPALKARPEHDRWGPRLITQPSTLRGTRNQNVEPCPSSLSTPIVPPCRCTIAWLMDRPSPLPPFSRVLGDWT